MNLATCPLCNASVPTPRGIDVGSTLFCPHCDCLLQVVSLDPPEVDFPYKLSTGSDDPKLARKSRRSSSSKP